MRKKNKSIKKFLKEKEGVFGLTSVQAFFAIVLGLALLAYVIVVIMGTLSTSNLLPDLRTSVVNESGSANLTGYTLSGASVFGFNSVSITTALNGSSGQVIPATNYTVSASGVVTNATALQYHLVNFSYSYSYYSASETQTQNVLANTSNGIASFFTAINPVYAILAVLVIILVLVVLVRVVTGGGGGLTRESSSPI